MVQLQAKQHLVFFGLILAKRIGSILISGNILDTPLNVLCNEKFASVVKLARFCSPDGLHRPCPTAALPPGRRVTVGAAAPALPRRHRRPGPAPPTLNKWQSIASLRAAAADALAVGR